MSNTPTWRKEFKEWYYSFGSVGSNPYLPSPSESADWFETHVLNAKVENNEHDLGVWENYARITGQAAPSSWVQMTKEKYPDGENMALIKRAAFLDGLSMCRGVIDAANRLFEFTEANLPPMTEDEETIINEIIKFKKVLDASPALSPDTYTEGLKELLRFDHCPEFLIDDPTFIKRIKVTKVSDMEEGEGKQWAMECIARHEAQVAQEKIDAEIVDFATWVTSGSIKEITEEWRSKIGSLYKEYLKTKGLQYATPQGNDGLSIKDYEEAIEDNKRLVRELDVIINGENAAKQASLCDIVSQCANIFNNKQVYDGWVRVEDEGNPKEKGSYEIIGSNNQGKITPPHHVWFTGIFWAIREDCKVIMYRHAAAQPPNKEGEK